MTGKRRPPARLDVVAAHHVRHTMAQVVLRLAVQEDWFHDVPIMFFYPIKRRIASNLDATRHIMDQRSVSSHNERDKVMSTIRRRASRPSKRQCAMLIAYLLKKKNEEGGRDVTRAQLSPSTLQRLLGRRSVSPQLLTEIGEWLLRAGWVLFFAGTTYAIVRLDVVQGWNRVSSKRIRDDIHKVGIGEFDFEALEGLLLATESDSAEQE